MKDYKKEEKGQRRGWKEETWKKHIKEKKSYITISRPFRIKKKGKERKEVPRKEGRDSWSFKARIEARNLVEINKESWGNPLLLLIM